jgi:hypothetical protein
MIVGSLSGGCSSLGMRACLSIERPIPGQDSRANLRGGTRIKHSKTNYKLDTYVADMSGEDPMLTDVETYLDMQRGGGRGSQHEPALLAIYSA